MKSATPNPALRDFWFTKARYRVLYGGRDSSKSWDAAQIALFLASRFKLKFLCTRKFQNRIEESVYALLKNQIDRYGYTGFELQKSKITHTGTGSEFHFYGIARNLTEIKSLEGVDIMWNEESQYFTEEDARIIIPTIRKEGSQIWFIFNPHLETDYIYQNFVLNPPDDAIVRCINYDENKWLSDTSRREIEALKERNYEQYLHVYKAHPLKNDDESIIRRAWLEACIDAHIKLGLEDSGGKVIGYDVADDGQDKNAIVYRRGIIALHSEQWKGDKDEMFASSKRVFWKALEYNAHVNYDNIGVGAGVGSNINELNDQNRKRITHTGFNAADAVFEPEYEYKHGKLNKDAFLNLKAQAWQNVSDRIENTYRAIVKGIPDPQNNYISISSDFPNLNELISELSAPKREFNSALKMKVESKDDMRKRGLKSPNLADAFIMAFYDTHTSFDYSKLPVL